jgi:hypothetical protein
MFSTFSRSYYVGRLFVAPRDGDRAVVHDDLQERVNEQLYADDEALARLDAPLVMKLGNRHFAVHGADDVPGGRLELPRSVLADADVRNPPSREEVLLAKRDVAARMLELSGQRDGPAGV